jgi:ribonuclease HII
MRHPASAEPSPDLHWEFVFRRAGVSPVAGLDEAGRGALAGPLMAAAVILPVGQENLDQALCGVRDSKRMTPAQRSTWADRIREIASDHAVGQASAAEVDALGPLRASRLAMTRALEALGMKPAHLLIDYVCLPEVELPQTALPHGDARVLSIAAASVLAKVTRDQHMEALDAVYPGYGFKRHKGYGTWQHRHALSCHGPTPAHRLSYSPVAAATRHEPS